MFILIPVKLFLTHGREKVNNNEIFRQIKTRSIYKKERGIVGATGRAPLLFAFFGQVITQPKGCGYPLFFSKN
jgi:hypothetical protein